MLVVHLYNTVPVGKRQQSQRTRLRLSRNADERSMGCRLLVFLNQNGVQDRRMFVNIGRTRKSPPAPRPLDQEAAAGAAAQSSVLIAESLQLLKPPQRPPARSMDALYERSSRCRARSSTRDPGARRNRRLLLVPVREKHASTRQRHTRIACHHVDMSVSCSLHIENEGNTNRARA